jgi:hypothetical protein
MRATDVVKTLNVILSITHKGEMDTSNQSYISFGAKPEMVVFLGDDNVRQYRLILDKIFNAIPEINKYFLVASFERAIISLLRRCHLEGRVVIIDDWTLIEKTFTSEELQEFEMFSAIRGITLDKPWKKQGHLFLQNEKDCEGLARENSY